MTLALYNVGEEEIKDITAEDIFFSTVQKDKFKVIQGSPKTSFSEPLAPQAATTYSFTIEPLALGELKDEPAVITYKTSSDGVLHASYLINQSS